MSQQHELYAQIIRLSSDRTNFNKTYQLILQDSHSFLAKCEKIGFTQNEGLTSKNNYVKVLAEQRRSFEAVFCTAPNGVFLFFIVIARARHACQPVAISTDYVMNNGDHLG